MRVERVPVLPDHPVHVDRSGRAVVGEGGETDAVDDAREVAVRLGSDERVDGDRHAWHGGMVVRPFPDAGVRFPATLGSWHCPRSSASTTTSSSRRTCGRPGSPRSGGRAVRGSSASGGARFKHLSGAKYDMAEDPDGEWGDAWYYDDELIYVQKKFVAIPAGRRRPRTSRATSSSTAPR